MIIFTGGIKDGYRVVPAMKTMEIEAHVDET